jgi:hypothetical protein
VTEPDRLRFTVGRRALQSEPIPGPGVRVVRAPVGKLEDMTDPEPRQREPSGRHQAHPPDHEAPIEERHQQREPHADRVHGPGPGDQQTGAGLRPITAQQTAPAFGR